MKFHAPDIARAAELPEHAAVLLCESVSQWEAAGSLYYKVYPAIYQTIESIKLEMLVPIFASVERRDRTIAIRFAEGHEIERRLRGESVFLRYMIAATGVINGRYSTVSMPVWERRADSAIIIAATGALSDDAEADSGFHYDGSDSIDGAAEMGRVALRAIACVLMLERDGDSGLVLPEVLDRDQAAFNYDPARREQLVERARRRGKNGFSIGREYETTPHFRRPHFAIRHTGPGGRVPKLVPVKASVVHRSTLTTVPTGQYIGGVEVEPAYLNGGCSNSQPCEAALEPTCRCRI